jgi:hypothetical protein
MARSLKGTILFVALTLVLLFAFASTAFALSITSTEVQQSSPGMTVRTIWGQAQVYQYPIKINHIGYAHVELTFKPSWASADLYVYGPQQWDTFHRPIAYQYFNVNQGYLGGYSWGLPATKDYVDWYVPYINNRLTDPNAPVDDPAGGYVGDTYYIVIVAFDDLCQTQVWGYVPTIDVSYAGSANPLDDWQVLRAFRFPKSTTSWQTVAGTPYGQPFDFTPTSTGTEYLTMQWPADVAAKTVSTDHSLGYQPAEYESYLYAADWSTTLQTDYEGSGGAASGWSPPTWSSNEGGITSPWYGYYEPLTVDVPTSDPGWMTAPAGKVQHWVASLGLVATTPANGPTIMLPADSGDPSLANATSYLDFAGPMKAGLSTIGYEATVGLPQNLTINTKSVSVKKGLSVTITGQLALDLGSGVAFQSGQSVKVQKKVGSSWVTVKTVVTGTDGKFSAKVVPTATTTWRAYWTGSPTTGLTIETSLTKKISVHL